MEQDIIDYFCWSIKSAKKSHRGSMLKKLNENLFNSENEWILDDQPVDDAWEKLRKPLARTLTDPSEFCRNSSVDLWKKFLAVVPTNEGNIVHLVPILSRRLSSQEIQEPSEEVRLNCVTLLRLVVTRYAEHLAAYSDDIVAILARTVADNYPEVKRESSECIGELASAVPAQFYPRSESLVKPILGNFGHQHWKVRAASVRAIGLILIYGQSKSMEEVATPMAQRLFDQSGAVRRAVVEVAGCWFVKLRDRYSWWYKLIPLLATGLHDEIESIRIRAAQLWDEAGKLYLRENENDERIKDKLDFLDDGVDSPQTREFFKKFAVERANLGCRVIVQQNLGKLVNGIGRELGDWLVDVRIRSAQLLCVLALNAEQDVVQHVEKLLPPMYRACDDEDSRVATNVELAAKYMGHFVPPSIYCPLILQTLQEFPTSGQLRVFAAMMSGSDSSTLCPELPNIVRRLSDESVAHGRKKKLQEALLACCDSIMTICQKDCWRVGDDLFKIIFTILAISEEKSDVEERANFLLDSLSKTEEMSQKDMYVCCLQPVMESLQESCESWSIDRVEFRILCAALTRIPRAIARNADDVLPILRATMAENADQEVRLKVFVLLAEFFDTKVAHTTDPKLDWRDTIERLGFPILWEAVLPALVWKAGRKAAATRTAALAYLSAVLDVGNEGEKTSDDGNDGETIGDGNEGEKTSDDCRGAVNAMITYSRKGFAEMIPIVVTLIDDNAQKNRLYALRAICRIFAIGKRLWWVNEDEVHAVYPAIVKRLDDGCDDVRAAAAEALVRVWRARPKNYDLVFGKSHVDYLYTTAIVHLDDPDPKFRGLMFDSLVELAEIHPELLATKIVNCRENFQNQSDLDRLLEVCHDRLRSEE